MICVTCTLSFPSPAPVARLNFIISALQFPLQKSEHNLQSLFSCTVKIKVKVPPFAQGDHNEWACTVILLFSKHGTAVQCRFRWRTHNMLSVRWEVPIAVLLSAPQ